MITLQRYPDLGTFKNSWLNAHYHFSFSQYYNPKWTALGALRVINDDIVSAGGGFDMHPHRDMEIITYVRSGAITHKDSLGNSGCTAAGEVQVMSAGTGITHAEYNQEKVDTNLYQIWITPHTKNVTPRWEQRTFPKNTVTDALPLLVSGFPEHKEKDALFIHADGAIYGGTLAAGTVITHALTGDGYILASEGSMAVNGHALNKGDGAAITEEKTLTLTAITDCEIVIIDVR